MVQLPSAIVDFADALKALVDSQSDVTQLVTKWDELTNTDTPGTVKIVLSNGTEHTVDNLAKIRNDLVEGLALDNPSVWSISFKSSNGAGGMISAGGSYGSTFHNGVDGSGNVEDPFDRYRGSVGFARMTRNEFYTTCVPNKDVCDFHLFQMPRVMWLGQPDAKNSNVALSNYTFNIKAPPASWATSGNLVEGAQYYGQVTLINAYLSGSTPLGDVTVNIVADPGNAAGGTRTIVIPQKSYVTLLLWAAPGQALVNIVKLYEGTYE